MSSYKKIILPSYEEIPVEEHSQALKLVLEICHQQQERLEYLEETVVQLKDEIAILKGEKARPKIKPSTLNKDRDDNENKKGGKKNTRKSRKQNRKKQEIEIHDTKILHPEHIPEGSIFKGYEDYVVQDLEIKPKNIKYRRARYETPDGTNIFGKLPESVKGSHFGSQLQSYILLQSYQLHVPQRLILQQLWEFGICISAGQVNRLIVEGHEQFHSEKEDVLRMGLRVSSHINVDDTGARHKGKNGYCTHIGNELFASFFSTESKSRINFLSLLRAGSTDFVVDEVARDYMEQHRLPKPQLELLSADRIFPDGTSWQAHLSALGITRARGRRIASEGALLASVVKRGISSELVIMSDEAGQFNVAGMLNALCWVHAERNINKIIPFSDANREAQKTVRHQIWDLYQDLKQYRITPTENSKDSLDARFEQIFSQKTCFQTLNIALQRIYKNKKELLLVLERPEIPLHNNLSENDIRDYVKKRKISPTTRSDPGRKARDTFLSLKKTCQKNGISFWKYLQDRIAQTHNIAPLANIIHAAATASDPRAF